MLSSGTSYWSLRGVLKARNFSESTIQTDIKIYRHSRQYTAHVLLIISASGLQVG